MFTITTLSTMGLIRNASPLLPDTPIHPVSIRDTASPSGHGPRGDQLSRDGSTLVVNRPHFVDHPVTGEGRNNHPTPPTSPVQHPMPPMSPAQSHSPQPNNNWPAAQTQPVEQPQATNLVPPVPNQEPQRTTRRHQPVHIPAPPSAPAGAKRQQRDLLSPGMGADPSLRHRRDPTRIIP